MIEIVYYLLLGAAAGFLGGLLGIGGGLIVVPCLVAIFRSLDFPTTYLMHVAVGTSLGAMVFTAAASALAHHLKKGVFWHLFRALLPGIALGTFLGALVADELSSHTLQWIFGICETAFGAYFLFSRKKKEHHATQRKSFPLLLFTAVGVAIGSISSILGIGGGVITVPTLTALHIPMRNAIATSAATGFLIALIGAVSFLSVGLHAHLWSGTLGYLYLPAFFWIALSSTLAAPFGAKCAHTWPTHLLKHLFGALLLLAGLLMSISR